MDTRRLLIAAALSLAVMIAWGYFFPPPEPPVQTRTPPSEELPSPQEAPLPVSPRPEEWSSEQAPEVETAQPTDDPEAREEVAEVVEEVVVSGAFYRARLTNRGAQLISFELLDHQNADGGPVDLVRARIDEPYPFAIASEEGDAPPLNEVLFRVERSEGAAGEQTVTFRYRGAAGTARKRFTFLPNGLVEADIEVDQERPWVLLLGPGLRNPSSEELDNRFARRSAVWRNSEGLERIDPARAKAEAVVAATGLSWIGLQDTYFLTAFVQKKGVTDWLIEPAVAIPATGMDGYHYEMFKDAEALAEDLEDLGRELYVLARPSGGSVSLVCYLGPKEYDRLVELPYGLEETVELGWFRFLSLPLLWGLRWIHENLIANYGWAIILMTIIIRLVLFPLTHKSTVSMQKMQEINPKVQAIRQKYRGKLKDKQGRPNVEMQRKMNEETMALYKSEGVNPAGGCLPMLLQIPVLFAFYSLLSAAIELRHAPWILWIQDLSAKDPYYVLPIVMGATQFLQQKMTPASGDPMQRRMMSLMPIFFTVLFLGFPSGLVLYWLTNNVLGIGQQVLYKKWREARATAGGHAGSTDSKRGSEK